MTKTATTLIALSVAVFLLGTTYVGSAFSYRGDCVTAEAGLRAQQDQLKNNYDNMWKKFREVSQVPAMYTEDLKKVYDSAIQGRYGANGSQAAFQFIQEHNPNFDSSMYTQIQRTVEAGRNSFEADQKQLLSMKQTYEIVLNGNRAVFVAMWFKFPTMDLSKVKILTSDQTEKAFSDGKTDELKLR